MHIHGTLEKLLLSEIATDSGKESLDPDEDLLEHGMLDSMAIMKLIVRLEETFSMTIQDEEIIPENFQSLNSMVRFIEDKTKKQ
ncbi:MAG: acyl carrier protein [Deltaproteobacteria bacterium]